MKRLYFVFLISLIAVLSYAFHPYRGPIYTKTVTPEEWMQSGVWDNGWNVRCHPSVNAYEFQRQYYKNREVWDSMFSFLASVDLDTLAIGRYDIVPDGRCYVKVSEYTPRAAEDVNIEQHHRSIDLQYTLRGNELMGYAADVTVKKEYNPRKDVAHFNSDNVTYHKAGPEAFFLFFPSDYHQPSVQSTPDPGISRKFVITGGNTPSYSTTYVYDHDSNPLKIIRNGVTDMLATTSTVQLEFGQIDNLSLRYNGTQLKAVEDNAQSIVYAGASDFDDGAHTTVEYTYDANGNTLSDANRGIETIVYNAIGLPYSITLADGSKITNTYDANGVLLRRVTTTPSRLPGLPGNIGLGHTITTTEDRIGLYTYTGNTLSRIDTPMGYVDGNDSIRYYITDYQGNIRQVVNPDGEVLQDNHYYPFGMLMGESSDIVAANLPLGYFTNGGGNRFRYGAKELITTGGINLSDYTARYLDHAILRFLTPDPLREKYTFMTSYLYCGANPVMFIDPSGMNFILSGEDAQYFFRELQRMVGDYLELSIDENGNITGELINESEMTEKIEYFYKILTDSRVTLDFFTTCGLFGRYGNYFFGGGFMGTQLSETDGEWHVTAFQDINPSLLFKICELMNDIDADVWHEISEAYEAALMSLESKRAFEIGKIGNKDYMRAHNKAYPEAPHKIYDIWYDKNGVITQKAEDTILVKYYLKNPVKERGPILIYTQEFSEAAGN